MPSLDERFKAAVEIVQKLPKEGGEFKDFLKNQNIFCKLFF